MSEPRDTERGVKDDDVVGATEALAHRSSPVQRLLDMAVTWADAPAGQTRPRTNYRLMTQATAQDIDTMVELYRSGLTVRQIADETGFHRSTVGKHLEARGIDTRQLLLRPEQIQEAGELYEAGSRLEDLARLYGVSDTMIRTHLLRAGVKMRPGGRAER